jgi:hypothetical protein
MADGIQDSWREVIFFLPKSVVKKAYEQSLPLVLRLSDCKGKSFGFSEIFVDERSLYQLHISSFEFQ